MDRARQVRRAVVTREPRGPSLELTEEIVIPRDPAWLSLSLSLAEEVLAAQLTEAR